MAESWETTTNPPSPSSSSPPQTTSLFPISSETTVVTTTTSTPPPQWLNSSSFNTDLSIITNAVSSLHATTTPIFPSSPTPITYPHHHNDDDDDEKDDIIGQSSHPPSNQPPSYQLIDSSSESDHESKRKKNKGSKKKKKKRKRDRDTFEVFARKSGVRAWANSDTKPSAKDYYFDSRGDPDNLAFGCLYRMDIGKYKRYDAAKSSGVGFKNHSRLSHRGLYTGEEIDVDVLDMKLKSSGRYWSAKHSVLEYHRNFKRIRIVSPEKHVQVSCDEFIPLSDEDGDGDLFSNASVIVESWEDEVLRKTREFNRMTREHPHNIKVWLDFAEFQDKIASKLPQRGARSQMLEKKISILEKAAELNTEDEDLLLSLLKAYHNRDSADVLIGRWEKILMQHSGSVKLWREFLRVVQGDFSTFKVSELRKMYGHAIQALHAAYSKGHRQVHPTADQPYPETVDIDLEMGIVDIFLSLCRFEWQAGYHELATALLQAEVEYSLFYPPLQLTEQSKKRLFEHFWNSNGARVGEDGALGWSSWLEKEEEHRQNLTREMSVKEDEQGGWTGWFVPPSNEKEDSPNLEEVVITDVSMEGIEEQNMKQEEDDAALLRMLGIDVDAEANKEVHDAKTWVKWSQEELSRDHDQWMPVHINSGFSHSKDEMEEEQDQLSRIILFEDVSDYLFSLSSADARLYLVLQFIDFFGVEISHWLCTNSFCWNEKMLSLETLPNSFLQYLGSVDDVRKLERGSILLNMESLLHRSETIARTDIMKFLRNAALLCLKFFPRNHKIEEAILIAEEQTFVGVNTLQRAKMPSQALAKSLLKRDRQDVLLCGVYARREAAYRNFDHARKVFDMALSSMNGLPLEARSLSAPLLYLWYSEMELVNGLDGEEESTSRALHILSCLGSGNSYTSYQGRPSSILLLRAHQGFKERINYVRSSWVRNGIDESSIALICSAALFEELTVGWIAGIEVITNALSMVLPEKKSRSYQLEYLFNYLLKMLQKYHPQATFSKVLQNLSAGFEIYPFNPDIFCCLVHLGNLYTVPNKLRQIFDELFQKKPSVILWLFSLSYELSRGAPQDRIHGLFERTLASDNLRSSVLIWRCYISYEIHTSNFPAARRVFFRAIHSCPWSKMLWIDGFQKLHNVITAKELMDLQEVMRDKELNLRTDIYEILLQDEFNHN